MDDATTIARRISRDVLVGHALCRYGDHDQGCPAHDVHSSQAAARCTCGYSAILKEMARG